LLEDWLGIAQLVVSNCFLLHRLFFLVVIFLTVGFFFPYIFLKFIFNY